MEGHTQWTAHVWKRKKQLMWPRRFKPDAGLTRRRGKGKPIGLVWSIHHPHTAKSSGRLPGVSSLPPRGKQRTNFKGGGLSLSRICFFGRWGSLSEEPPFEPQLDLGQSCLMKYTHTCTKSRTQSKNTSIQRSIRNQSMQKPSEIIANVFWVTHSQSNVRFNVSMKFTIWNI